MLRTKDLHLLQSSISATENAMAAEEALAPAFRNNDADAISNLLDSRTYRLKGIYVDCGAQDDTDIPLGGQALSSRKSGALPAASTRSATSSTSFVSSFRDANTPVT